MVGAERTDKRLPKVKIDADEASLIALRLSKAGYGRPDDVLNMRSDLVVLAIEYERFQNDYQATYIELNKDNK